MLQLTAGTADRIANSVQFEHDNNVRKGHRLSDYLVHFGDRGDRPNVHVITHDTHDPHDYYWSWYVTDSIDTPVPNEVQDGAHPADYGMKLLMNGGLIYQSYNNQWGSHS